MSEALVLVVLVWAAVLVPGALRSHRTPPRARAGFEHAMRVVRPGDAQDGGRRPVPVPAGAPDERQGEQQLPSGRYRPEDRVVARRRLWFNRLLAATALTFLVAVVFGGWVWLAFGLTLALALVYVAVLRRLKLQRDEARRVLRDLQRPGPLDPTTDDEAAAGAEGDRVPRPRGDE